MLKKTFIFLLLLPSLLFARNTGVNRHRDFQTWIFDSFSHKLAPKRTFYVDSEVRFGDDSSILYLAYVQFLYRYDVRHWLALVPGYRQQWQRGSAGLPFDRVYVPFFDAVLQKKSKQLILTDRNRLQYAIFSDRNNVLVYRNRVHLTTEKKFGRLKARPYIANEIFISERRGYDQNRLAIGVNWIQNEHLNPALHYMIRHRKTADEVWEYQHVLGIFAFITF